MDSNAVGSQLTVTPKITILDTEKLPLIKPEKKIIQPDFSGPENDNIRPQKGYIDFVTNDNTHKESVTVYWLTSPTKLDSKSYDFTTKQVRLQEHEKTLCENGYVIFTYTDKEKGTIERAAVHGSQVSYIQDDKEDFPNFKRVVFSDSGRDRYAKAPRVLPSQLGGGVSLAAVSTKSISDPEVLTPAKLRQEEQKAQAGKIKAFTHAIKSRTHDFHSGKVKLDKVISKLPVEQRAGLKEPAPFMRDSDFDKMGDFLDLTGYRRVDISEVNGDTHINRVYFVKEEATVETPQPYQPPRYQPTTDDQTDFDNALGLAPNSSDTPETREAPAAATTKLETPKTPISKKLTPFKFVAYPYENGTLRIIKEGGKIPEKQFKREKSKLENDLPTRTIAYRDNVKGVRYFYDEAKTYTLSNAITHDQLREILLDAPLNKDIPPQHTLPIETWQLMKTVLKPEVSAAVEEHVEIDAKKGTITFYLNDSGDTKSGLKDPWAESGERVKMDPV